MLRFNRVWLAVWNEKKAGLGLWARVAEWMVGLVLRWGGGLVQKGMEGHQCLCRDVILPGSLHRSELGWGQVRGGSWELF